MQLSLKQLQLHAKGFEKEKVAELVELSQQQSEKCLLLLDSLQSALPQASAQLKQLGGPWHTAAELQDALQKSSWAFLEELSQYLRTRLQLAGEESGAFLKLLLDLVEAHCYASVYQRAAEVEKYAASQLKRCDHENLGKLTRRLFKHLPEAMQTAQTENFLKALVGESAGFERLGAQLGVAELKALNKGVSQLLSQEDNPLVKQLLSPLERYLSSLLMQKDAL